MAEKTYVRIVPPHKATKESLWLLVLMALVVVLAFFVIGANQRDVDDLDSLQPYELSVRYDLKPQEQGIVADLLLAFDELKFARRDGVAEPDVSYWVDENFPPFTDRIEGKSRGDHEWTMVALGARKAYLGVSADVEVARHLLWVLPRDEGEHGSDERDPDDFELWIHGGAEKPALPANDLLNSFVSKGWKLVNRSNEIKR